MTHEEIATFEVAKLAKEKGFSWHTRHIYDEETKELIECKFVANHNSEDGIISAPTQSLLQRWLRENHKADVWVETVATMATKNQRCYYWHIAYDSDGSCIYVLDSMLSYHSYEKALEEGLREGLIEFV